MATKTELTLDCECASRGWVDEMNEPLQPIVVTCLTCYATWCDRCNGAPAARCHFEYDHEDLDD
jgi:hypothetical protein